MRIARTMVRSVLPCILTVALILGVISPATNALAAPASLSVPTNVKWMDGSTATATWDPVSGANYYKVSVSVYNSGTCLGSKITGTPAYSIDVQDLIQSISGVSSYNSVDVSFSVQAVYQKNGSVILSSNWSSYSVNKSYSIIAAGNKYQTPTGVSFNESNLTVSWKAVSDATFYDIYYYIYNEDQDWEEYYWNSSVYFSDGIPYADYDGTVTVSGGRITVDVSKVLSQAAVSSERLGQDLQIYCKVRVYSQDTSQYAHSDFSKASNVIDYNYNVAKYQTPTGVSFNESNLTVSWKAVSDATFYDIYYYIYNEDQDWEEYYWNSSVYFSDGIPYADYDGTVTVSGGRITVDVSKVLSQAAVSSERLGQDLQIYCKVRVYSQDTSQYAHSDFSKASNVIVYNYNVAKYQTPTGVSFNENNLTVSWKAVSDATFYDIYYYIYNEDQDWEEYYWNSSVYFSDGIPYADYDGTVTVSGGRITVDVSKVLSQAAVSSERLGQDLQIYCKVRVYSQDTSQYAHSDFSKASNVIFYRYQLGKTVESITISPNNPYVPVGYTYSLGKTIEPIDAYYSSMSWTSNDNSVVTVDSLGTITGVAEGNATVTARVGAASDTANVTVYILETNVVEECEEEVLNNTNEIINSIVAGDATCTDITNVTKAAELIETGMDNEDEFHIDIEQEACGQEYSSAGWNTIESLYSGNPDFDPEYAGAVDVSLELYSEDDAGKETSIGNITEFDNEIQFDISIPAGLPAVEPGYVREYSVVRVHDGQYSVLDCTLNADYTVTVESDKFSDFVLVYDDVLDVNAMPSSEFLSSGIAHVQDIGNVGVTVDPETGALTIGTRGMGKRLEEITIYFNNPTPYSGTLEYRVHVQDIGWMDWVEAGQPAGTEGISKRIEAIEIRLTGDLAKYYSVEYCVHIQDYGDAQGWVHDGALAGTTGESKRIEELKIRIVPKNSGSSMSVKYRVHVQDYGWEKSYATNGAMSGTSGEAKRLEGIELFLSGTQYSGGIKYKTHVQDYGWQGWSYDGEMSGTQGEAKRLEGICIELYGEIAEYYDIYYRVHAQDIGWMAWAKNGECAGTAGRSARLEGIQIVLVPKGEPAPGATYEGITAVTDKAFIEGF